MAILINAKPQVLNVGTNAGKKVYKLTPHFSFNINSDGVCKHAAEHSNLSPIMIKAALGAVAESIREYLVLGHSVELGGLGTLRLSMRARTVEKLEDVDVDNIYRRRLVFTPGTDIQRYIDSQKLEIVCYDENGKKVRRVNCEDDD